MSEESEILDLMRQADTEQFERDIYKLERLVAVGDQIAARKIVSEAAIAESSDPT